MVVFLSQLNDLEIWDADVGNAYLETYTDEKLCIIAGPEFKELQGHLSLDHDRSLVWDLFWGSQVA